MRSPSPAPDLALAEVATCARPADQHAALRARGVHRRDGCWVVVREGDVVAALASTGRLCDALACSLHPAPATQDRDLAAGELTALLAPLGDEDHVAAGAGVLFQARDATAALIGAAVLAEEAAPPGAPGPRLGR